MDRFRQLHQGRHLRSQRPADNLLGAAALDDFAAMVNKYGVGQTGRFQEIMGDQDHRNIEFGMNLFEKPGAFPGARDYPGLKTARPGAGPGAGG